MSLKKFFSLLTFTGIFLTLLLLLIGSISGRNFVYAIIPFMLVMSIFFYMIFHDSIKETSDKIAVFLCILLIFFSGAYFVNGFKIYSDLIYNNEPYIQAQIKQNDQLMQNILTNNAYADNMKTNMEINKQNSLILKNSITDLINKETNLVVTQEPEIIEELVYVYEEKPVLTNQNNNVFYEWDNEGDDD